MNEISENTLEFRVSEKEGMSKIVCDQLVKMISCCSTEKFLKRLLLLQELTSSWMNNDDICLVTVKKGVPTSGSEHLAEFIMEPDSKSYNSQQESVMEEKNINNGCDAPGMYCCEQCGGLFDSVEQLKYHFESHRAVDLQKPPFKCGNCEKEFTRPESLRRHMMTHSDEKSYACCECGKRFSRIDHLTLHKRTHTGERPYKCHECGKQFGSGPLLKKHIGMHEKSRTPFICNS